MMDITITECVRSIKIKNCEGYDRIPQRILVDGIDHLAVPLTQLFNQIYQRNELTDQWRISKVCPYSKRKKNMTLKTLFLFLHTPFKSKPHHQIHFVHLG